MIDTAKLKGLIVEKGYNVTTFAKEIGMTRLTLDNKLNNKSQTSIGESLRIKHALDMDDNTYIRIFYEPQHEFNADSDFKNACNE